MPGQGVGNNAREPLAGIPRRRSGQHVAGCRAESKRAAPTCLPGLRIKSFIVARAPIRLSPPTDRSHYCLLLLLCTLRTLGKWPQRRIGAHFPMAQICPSSLEPVRGELLHGSCFPDAPYFVAGFYWLIHTKKTATPAKIAQRLAPIIPLGLREEQQHRLC